MLPKFFPAGVALSIVALFSVSAYASCALFEVDQFSSDSDYSFQVGYSVFLQNFTCPWNSPANCNLTVSGGSYNIQAQRGANVTLGAAEADDLFVAARAYILNSGTYSYNRTSLLSLNTYNTTVVARAKNVPDDGEYNVSPGRVVTLSYRPFNYYITGHASGCSNATLNNLGVRLRAPVAILEQNGAITVPGGFQTYTSNMTNATQSAQPSTPATSVIPTGSPTPTNHAARTWSSSWLVGTVGLLAIAALFL